MRCFAIALVCMYLGAGLFAGLLMQRAIPAINTLGIAYIAASWPRQIICAREADNCDVLPDWLAPYIFSIPRAGHEGDER